MHSSPVIKHVKFLLLLRYVTQQNIQSFNPTGMTNKRWNFWKYNSMVAMLQTYSRFRITLLSHQRNVADTQFCNQASLCRMVVLKSSALTVSKGPGGKAILPSKDSKAFKRRTHSKLSGEGSCSAHPSVTVNRTEEREKVFPIKFQNDPCAWVQKEVAIWSPVHSHFTCNQGEINFPKLQVNVQLIVPDMLYTHTHTHVRVCA